MGQINRQEFLEKGFVIVRNLIRPDRLGILRDRFEDLVRHEWPDGVPDGSYQPRIYGYSKHVDASTADTMEFMHHESTMGLSRKLMGVEDVGLAYHFLMCNPVRDHGPWFWHRDFTPVTEGPLEGPQTDFLANGPVLVQWNVALYDDDVLEVVPGSHVRPNTGEENAQLGVVPHSYAKQQPEQGEPRHTSLPGSVLTDLKAGDGVAYVNMLLHRGSRYGPKPRRCIHFGHRAFGGRRFFHEGLSRTVLAAEHLSPEARGAAERCVRLYDEERGHVEGVYRAILDKDEAGFQNHLAELHPGDKNRFVCLVHLCKIAQRLKPGGAYDLPLAEDEIEQLWRRFSPLDEALKADEDQYMPGFQVTGPTPYRFYDLPKDFGIEQFVRSWR